MGRCRYHASSFEIRGWTFGARRILAGTLICQSCGNCGLLWIVARGCYSWIAIHHTAINTLGCPCSLASSSHSLTRSDLHWKIATDRRGTSGDCHTKARISQVQRINLWCRHTYHDCPIILCISDNHAQLKHPGRIFTDDDSTAGLRQLVYCPVGESSVFSKRWPPTTLVP